MKFLTLIVVVLGLAISLPSGAAVTKTEATESMGKVQLVNVNQATVEQLTQLPGIGKSKAQAIVDYRTEQGKFKSVADLAQVKGIGDKLVAKLDGKVTF
ncbi:MAG: competence protein ComEA [Pseudoalteromonas rhizosphaerae]|jgi:competence protein ComEA|uniref:ComEA family DNA-binding protein n=1 Tax=Pseudoalteromonas neustonica TaxID=1840331 RepID=A0ABY3FDD2_9GAMM|nr:MULTISPECIES: ComEA family DNA-binding protein [Pseudoalteromonas]MBB1293630.1 ComEA family DNA-binding protein [Pseudoalteromonas sp. SR41-4]MBB1300546.1 ComEA family DNA-binding protein [Pseudoalteromonas sp. SR44-8]MBB1309522.1 ComEA family DNA-binding protein [Pseudoalteromonas sp. SR41-8]MBB1397598.1 ComEA family DNA-binding protein [Pseudoalteromonas sp. SG44-8]MBB1409269.1 ComEA family DNA-binding protein [Pseudoalteromonas sp. SG44-17]|tara:strand:+ start:981 stop:1277 length:297 start_codon:yes stop_codon:yes gene_type:complete